MNETIPEKRFKKSLPVDLTAAEKVTKGHKAGALKKAIQKVRAEMKLATADHKETLKNHQANLDSILDDLESGTEERKVECVERKDFKRKKAETIRLDTNEVVETRAMYAEEFQETFPGSEVKDVKDVGLSDDIEPPAAKRGRGRPRKEASA